MLRHNAANRYPRRIICFDTEARILERKTYERQTFRLAAASYDRILPGSLEPADTERMVFFEPEHLWEWITGKTKPKARTVCFAHNLAYDLRISDGLRLLPRFGFKLEFLTLDSNRCVARFKRGSATLLLCDTSSWLPTTLERVADRVGIKKVPLPDQSANETEWANRCSIDVDITRAAIVRLLVWLERNDLGNFRLTGPAMAMGAYRHRFLPRCGLLVHKDQDALAAERTAAWAGRCEVWRHGEVAGPLHEWDYRLAYLTVAQTASVPVRLRGVVDNMTVPNLRRLSRHRAILCECDVETDTPIVPAKLNGGVGWPVGKFQTTLWDRELLLAASLKARVSIRRAWVYMKYPALSAWASWLLDLLALDGLRPDALERLMLKDWARSLIGRFGARWPQWEKVAKLPESDLQLIPYIVHETGETGAYLQNGHDWLEKTGMVDAPDAMPAIMGYIMSLSRLRLWDAIKVAGEGSLVYCDTDSLVVTDEGHERLLVKYPPGNSEGLIHKATHKAGLFLGPRQVRLGTELRIAGLPKNAIQRGPKSFEAVVWEGLAEGIRLGRPNEVRLTRRAVTVKGGDRRRRHLAGGSTAPFVLSGDKESPD